jgi:hypothetical protein
MIHLLACQTNSIRMRHKARRQIMLDQPVQGTLMKRVTTYWFLCIGSTVLMSWLWCSFSHPEMTIREWIEERLFGLIVPLLGSLLFLPLAWADIVRLSNRIVAPVHSIRTAIRRVMLGDDVPPLVARPDDFWQDLTGQFNRLSSWTTITLPTTECRLDSSRSDDCLEAYASEEQPITVDG